MKQRLGIAAALLGEPDLPVLDEPANGLDPAGILEIRALLRSVADDGSTVFVSSHLLAEIEQLADRLVLIKHGRLLFEGMLEELLARQRGTLVLAPERHQDLEGLARVVAASGYQVAVGPPRLRVDAPGDAAAALNRAAMATRPAPARARSSAPRNRCSAAAPRRLIADGGPHRHAARGRSQRPWRRAVG
jgi:ABC-2 type transport system ATP-binding protein